MHDAKRIADLILAELESSGDPLERAVVAAELFGRDFRGVLHRLNRVCDGDS